MAHAEIPNPKKNDMSGWLAQNRGRHDAIQFTEGAVRISPTILARRLGMPELGNTPQSDLILEPG